MPPRGGKFQKSCWIRGDAAALLRERANRVCLQRDTRGLRGRRYLKIAAKNDRSLENAPLFFGLASGCVALALTVVALEGSTGGAGGSASGGGIAGSDASDARCVCAGRGPKSSERKTNGVSTCT